MTILQIDNQYYSVLNWTNEGVVVAHLQTGAIRCISYVDFPAHVYAVQHDGYDFATQAHRDEAGLTFDRAYQQAKAFSNIIEGMRRIVWDCDDYIIPLSPALCADCVGDNFGDRRDFTPEEKQATDWVLVYRTEPTL